MGTEKAISLVVTCNNIALDASSGIISATVESAINKIAWAEIVLADGTGDQKLFPTSNSPQLKIGTPIKIDAGYGSDTATLFKGRITAVGLRADGTDSSYVIEAKDDAYRMTMVPRTIVYTEVTDSDIATTIAKKYKLKTDIASTTGTYDSVLQHQVTDWDFLLCRLQSQSQLVYANLGTVTGFDIPGPGKAALTLTYGKNISSFDVAMDSRLQFAASQTVTWDIEGQKLVPQKGKTPSVTDPGGTDLKTLAGIAAPPADLQPTFIRPGTLTDDQATALASANLGRAALAKMLGKVVCPGTTDVKPGSLVELKGLGASFDGTGFAGRVRHIVEPGLWTTEIQLGLDPQWLMDHITNTGGLDHLAEPLLKTLQLGKVVKISEDPLDIGRVQVLLPLVYGKDASGVWCRMARLDAGNNRGSFYLPEVDDEVLVGFVGANDLNPVILGMLHGKTRKAPYTTPDDKNDIKGFYSRTNMQVIFDDKAPSLSLSTPGGASVVMNDEKKTVTIVDQNGNTLAMSDSGIEISSVGNMSLSAKGNIDIKATGNASIEGQDTKAMAMKSLTLQGTTGTELSSPMTTTVKGMMVQIN